MLAAEEMWSPFAGGIRGVAECGPAVQGAAGAREADAFPSASPSQRPCAPPAALEQQGSNVGTCSVAACPLPLAAAPGRSPGREPQRAAVPVGPHASPGAPSATLTGSDALSVRASAIGSACSWQVEPQPTRVSALPAGAVHAGGPGPAAGRLPACAEPTGEQAVAIAAGGSVQGGDVAHACAEPETLRSDGPFDRAAEAPARRPSPGLAARSVERSGSLNSVEASTAAVPAAVPKVEPAWPAVVEQPPHAAAAAAAPPAPAPAAAAAPPPAPAVRPPAEHAAAGAAPSADAPPASDPLVLVAKRLTDSDVTYGRIILPRMAVEANLGFVAGFRSYTLAVTDARGASWEFVIKSWANGHEHRRVYALEQAAPYLRANALGVRDCLGICLSPDGALLVRHNTPGVGAATDRPVSAAPASLLARITPQAGKCQPLICGDPGQCSRSAGCAKPAGHPGFCSGPREGAPASGHGDGVGAGAAGGAKRRAPPRRRVRSPPGAARGGRHSNSSGSGSAGGSAGGGGSAHWDTAAARPAPAYRAGSGALEHGFYSPPTSPAAPYTPLTSPAAPRHPTMSLSPPSKRARRRLQLRASQGGADCDSGGEACAPVASHGAPRAAQRHRHYYDLNRGFSSGHAGGAGADASGESSESIAVAMLIELHHLGEGGSGGGAGGSGGAGSGGAGAAAPTGSSDDTLTVTHAWPGQHAQHGSFSGSFHAGAGAGAAPVLAGAVGAEPRAAAHGFVAAPPRGAARDVAGEEPCASTDWCPGLWHPTRKRAYRPSRPCVGSSGLLQHSHDLAAA